MVPILVVVTKFKQFGTVMKACAMGRETGGLLAIG